MPAEEFGIEGCELVRLLGLSFVRVQTAFAAALEPPMLPHSGFPFLSRLPPRTSAVSDGQRPARGYRPQRTNRDAPALRRFATKLQIQTWHTGVVEKRDRRPHTPTFQWARLRTIPGGIQETEAVANHLRLQLHEGLHGFRGGPTVGRRDPAGLEECGGRRGGHFEVLRVAPARPLPLTEDPIDRAREVLFLGNRHRQRLREGRQGIHVPPAWLPAGPHGHC
mmetsp:Transcript_77891/g.252529  ORF Transcript_77891/g.252529 Transcript_77891/m.252529 type:complete len:222 (-) Transcript_77891:562-1227(-)